MEVTPTSEVEERLAAVDAALEATLLERNRLWEQLKRQQADLRELEYLRAEVTAARGSRLLRLGAALRRLRQR
jgi:hypothetical protein